MLSLDGTLIVQLVNFIVFLAILNAIFFKPVGAAIARRRAFIDGLRHDIEQLHGEAKTLRGRAEERRAAARREADELIARARVDAGKESDVIVGRAQERASEIVASAHAEVEQELQRARADEPRIVNALADDILGRALGGLA
ncbi:MAG: F-type H+-transporting ATPase subunit b [Candidatus Eremiobacteraeota bacterium]|jgi:F-type H+-transporting ATPase subunit b|nr:F-type H+-transporting ATPase subunit b [Candidatus Eremiobacteraeota bacterium]